MSPTFFSILLFRLFYGAPLPTTFMGHHSQNNFYGVATPHFFTHNFYGVTTPIFLHNNYTQLLWGHHSHFLHNFGVTNPNSNSFYGVITPIFYTTLGLPIPIKPPFMGSSLPFSTQLWGSQSQIKLPFLWGRQSQILICRRGGSFN